MRWRQEGCEDGRGETGGGGNDGKRGCETEVMERLDVKVKIVSDWLYQVGFFHSLFHKAFSSSSSISI